MKKKAHRIYAAKKTAPTHILQQLKHSNKQQIKKTMKFMYKFKQYGYIINKHKWKAFNVKLKMVFAFII